MANRKKFHLKEVLGALHGRLLGDMDGIYDVLNWLTQDNLFTHQLPRAFREVSPWLSKRYPELAKIDMSWCDNLDKTNPRPQINKWLAEQVKVYGQFFDLEPIPKDEHRHIHPLTEMEQMMPNKPIIVVDFGDSPKKDSQ